jgi:hypothetical protein
MRQSILCPQRHQGLSVYLDGWHVPAPLGEDRCQHFRIRHAGDMGDLVGQGERRVHPVPGLVGIAQTPESQRVDEARNHARVKATQEGKRVVLGSAVEAQTLLQVHMGGDRFAQIKPDAAQGMLGHQAADGGRLVVRQIEELLRQGRCCPELRLYAIIPTESMEHLEALPWLPYLLTQRVRPAVDLMPFWVSKTFGNDHGRPQGELQCRVSSCCARSGLSGSVASNASPLVRMAIAS